MIFLPIFLLALLTLGQAVLRPLPLAVRSPYLNTWFISRSNSSDGYDTVTSPPDLTQSQARGWTILLRVDNVTYSFLAGVAPQVASPLPFSIQSVHQPNITDIVVTPTKTVLVAEAGKMQVNLSILRPFEPGNWLRQSIPFAYASITAEALDNATHSVQMYTDISPPGLDAGQNNLWNLTSNGDVMYYSINLANQVTFTELGSGPEPGWGTLYYAMKSNNTTHLVTNIPWTEFLTNGVLTNDSITSGVGSTTSVFALATDLGFIQATQDPLVLTAGYITDPAISYTNQSGTSPQARRPYFRTKYPDDTSLIRDFLNEFSNASLTAQQFDLKVLRGAATVSGLLGDLVSPVLAQLLGSTQLTVGLDASGRNINESDVMMFMKNVAGSATSDNRVNPVETLYSAFPALMYIDPTLGALLLEPLFRLQAQPNYYVQYAAADLGSGYPAVAANLSIHNDQVEQTGNMLIMTYAHARASGDGSLIRRYYNVLVRWAEYLSILSSVLAGPVWNDGETELTIKGIIAIEAMSKMSSILGQKNDAEKYANTSSRLYAQWKGLVIKDDRLLGWLGDNNSWSLGYNLFPDKWLGTNVVDSSIYDGQSDFMKNLMVQNQTIDEFGFRMDNTTLVNQNFTVTPGWNLFAAAMTSDDDLRSRLIDTIYNQAYQHTTWRVGAIPLFYNVSNVSYTDSQTSVEGIGSAAQGALFAPLALMFVQRTEPYGLS
ncbi:hypothetical protein BC826DRAFT_302706 [Russula brevipes]|nr:hypothetical protein BC826DRAFT_302706 [Russula brevipes]